MPSDTGATDLDESLTALAQLVLGADPLDVTLGRIEQWATHAIPGADGVALAAIAPRHEDTVVVTADVVRDVVAVQHELGEGPCVTAAEQARTVVAADLATDARWPRFGPRAAALGVRSVLSVPLVVAEGVVGALTAFAHAADTFDDVAVGRAEAFAAAAAVTVHNVRKLVSAEGVIAQLRAALTNRAVIDQAIGILMSRQGGTAEEAFDALRRMSQAENAKLATVAQTLVDEAVKRARARRRGR